MGGRAKLVMSRVVTDPPVVILLSTFNGAPFLDQQLQSIVDQSYDNLSLIIRDDGSTDRTLQILAEFERTAARPVRIIRGSNRGAMA
ncbi:MAG: glycosyltransferase, partial [Pseudomonadota bacterium]